MRIIIFLLIVNPVFAQYNYILEGFPGGIWEGDTVDFSFENNTLQLTADPVTSVSTIYMPSQVINDAEWNMTLTMDFNPSSNNYTTIILAADTFPMVEGYYLQVGSTADDLKLYYKNGNSINLLIDGPDKVLDNSSNTVQIRITKNTTWALEYRLDSLVDFTILHGPIHNNLQRSYYYGIECKYTSTRSKKFKFSNIEFSGFGYIDTEKPFVTESRSSSSSEISIEMNEPVFNGYVEVTNNTINVNTSGNEIKIDLDAEIENGHWVELKLSEWEDLAGNQMMDTTLRLRHFIQGTIRRGDVVINELMIDPSPPNDLPESEYLELWNISESAINLENWSMADKKTSSLLPEYILLPDSMVLLIPYQHSQDFKIKNKIGLHPWPTLNNTSDSIYLTTSENDVMHQIGYDERGFDSFYGDGSSIELENPWNPCGEVWKTTTSSTGGTPGTINSIFTTQNDTSHLEIVDYDHRMNGTLMVYLNKPIDTISINKSTFFINGDQVFPDLNQSMGALITFPFVGISGIFTLTIEDLVDCWSNPLSENTITWTADFDPPEIDSINYSHFDELTIYFNESIEQPEPENIFLDGIGIPSNITLQPSNAFKLRFPTTLYPQEHFKISIINVSDIRGNILDSTYLEVDLVPPKMARSFEVIVTEFKPITNNEDEYEYIELYNNSESPWLLRGYSVADNRNETTLDDYLLLPHTFVVLLPSTKKSATGIKNVLFVKNWNSLNNDGDIISIRNPAGDIIHQIEYNKAWFESLSIHDSHEMIDTAFPCRGLENWKGVSKGSPGFQNSVKDSKPDLVGPSILSSWIEGEDSVMIVFDERLDTLSILSATYSFIPNISDFKISVIANNQILISLDNPLSKSEPYKLIAEYIKDCSGNAMTKQNIELINPDYPQKDDVVINEILFNPEVGGVDFIEVYNTSNKYFKIKDFRIGGLNDTLSIKSEILLHPHQFMVFTKSKELLMNFHPSAPYEKIVESDLPQLPDDAGIVILLADSVIDQFSYSEGLHHDLQINHEGVSLERLSPFEASDNPDNWKSAASIVGFATPGKLNSNYLFPENHEDIISIEPRVFNPDNSTQPFTTIYYQFKHPGNVTTVSVFDSNGVKVKTLLNNKTLGTTGFFTWEGTNDSSRRVRTGYYLLLFEIIHPNGKIEQLKEKIVVATEF